MRRHTKSDTNIQDQTQTGREKIDNDRTDTGRQTGRQIGWQQERKHREIFRESDSDTEKETERRTDERNIYKPIQTEKNTHGYSIETGT